MDFLKKFKDRYSIVLLVTAILFGILVLRLGKLTIIDGDEYRAESDKKKYKEISVIAPRGEIRDRNGKLLAGNRPSSTVQVLKKDMKSLEIDKQNEILEKLTTILANEGILFNSDYPIEMNVFKYRDGAENPENLSETDMIIERIINENLIDEVLHLSGSYSNDSSNENYFLAKRVFNILANEGTHLPIDIATDNGVSFSYNGKEDTNWFEENKLNINENPQTAILKIIENKNEGKILSELMRDSLSRKTIYDYLAGRRLVNDIEIVPFQLTYNEIYNGIKSDLMGKYEDINMNTTAKEDYMAILKENGEFSNIFENSFMVKKQNREEVVIPAEIFLDICKERGLNIPVKAVVDKGSTQVKYEVTNEKKLKEIYKKYDIDENTGIKDMLINIGERLRVDETKENLMTELVTGESMKNLSQQLVLKHENPKISVQDWEYSSLLDKKMFINSYSKKEDEGKKIDLKDNAETIFEKIETNTEIDEGLTDYESMNILSVHDGLNNLGYQGYNPLDIAGGVNDRVISQIEEKKSELYGVSTSLEFVRYYPMNETAAHIIGYIGKIAQEEEEEKYIKKLGYLPSALIGKTGIENAYEEKLKGKDGVRRVEVDSNGNTISIIEEESPIPGDTIYLTIDADLQKVSEDALEQALIEIRRGGVFRSEFGNYGFRTAYRNATSASAVSIDPQSGEVLALANYPSFDLNKFVNGVSEKDWKELSPDDGGDLLAPKPLYNTAMQTAVQPGSIYKPVVGLAALENGIPATKKIYDYGYVEIGDTKFGCAIWNVGRGSHGATDLYRALEESCNYYFYSAALGRVPKTGETLAGKAGIEEITKMAVELGLSEKTGIEIPGEVSQELPSPEVKKELVKALMKNFLDKNIDKYIVSEDFDKVKAIEEIASWIEGETLSKVEIVNRLANLGLNGELRLPGEREDLGDAIKYSYLDQSKWHDADILNVSIGQGENSFTPLQIAKYTSILANGGRNYDTTIIERIESYDNRKLEYVSEKAYKEADINKEYIENVNRGMYGGTVRGLIKSAFVDFPVKAAGKTGSAQREGINPTTGRKYDAYSWFHSFAPYEDGNPYASKIAVSTLVFQGGAGMYSAPVSREIMGQYLKEEAVENVNYYNLKNDLSE